MTTSFSQTVFSPWLTPVRLVSTSNIAGTYSNGPSNNGVGATLTVAASSLTIDSVLCEVGDRVLLHTQTNTYEQGIYVVRAIASTVILERSDDQQSIEQMKAGEYVAVGAGSINAGNFYTLVEPLPQVIGVDAIVFNADPSAGGVTFSGGPSTANAIPVFSDTAGNIKAANAAPVTLGQNLSVTGTGTFSGALASTAGNITSGSSGDAGTFISFPATAGNGTLILQAVNAGGAFNTTIASGTIGQSSVITIPDPGAATSKFVLQDGTNTSGTFTTLNATTGNITTVNAGADAVAGTVNVFPTTGTNGKLILAAVDAGAARNTTISNSAMGQSSVISIPDPGTATSKFVLQDGVNTVVSVANLKYGATPVAQVDPASCTIAAAAGASNVCTLTIQLKDGSGTNMARIQPFKVYASSAADGLTLASAASTGFSVASGGLSLANGTAVTTQISCMSSATGGCVLSLTDSAKQTSYIVLVLDSGAKISAQLSAGDYGA